MIVGDMIVGDMMVGDGIGDIPPVGEVRGDIAGVDDIVAMRANIDERSTVTLGSVGFSSPEEEEERPPPFPVPRGVVELWLPIIWYLMRDFWQLLTWKIRITSGEINVSGDHKRVEILSDKEENKK